jgi:hypothetical protein
MIMLPKNDAPEENSTPNLVKQPEGIFCLINPNMSLRAGMTCPRCHQGIIEYDGMLNLVCPNCGLTDAGCFT